MLGFGIAADAFTAALANGLNGRQCVGVSTAAAIFACAHVLMAALGTLCVRIFIAQFSSLETVMAIAAACIFFILGVKTIVEGLRRRPMQIAVRKSTLSALIVQSLATSADALSAGFAFVGFDAAEFSFALAVVAVITFIGYTVGFCIGRRFGANSSTSTTAAVCGGLIFIAMSVAVFLL